jgi:hypothetical protein
MKPHYFLGLYLAWSCSHGLLIILQLLFGMTDSAVAKYIQFACRIIIKVLNQDPFAKITMPSYEQQFDDISFNYPHFHYQLHNQCNCMPIDRKVTFDGG